MKYLFSNFFNVLKHFKSSAIINILGLTAALVVFFVVLMQIHYDLTYDKGYANSKKIFQFNTYEASENEVSVNINFQIPALIKERVPEIETYCIASLYGSEVFDIYTGSDAEEQHEINLSRATSGFWEVFTPEIIEGDTTGIFSTPDRVLISEKTANRIFGEESPIDKSLKFHYGNRMLTIGAVYKDFPDNSTMRNGIYMRLPEYDEDEWSFNAYFLVNPDNIEAANEKVNSPEIIDEDTLKHLEENPQLDYSYRLSPMNELYLSRPRQGGSTTMTTVITLLSIGILTIIIALVNFVNLSLAMAPSRVRGINIRRILGINKTTLRLTIAMESVLFTVISVALSLFVIYFLKSSTLAEQMFAANLSLGSHAGLLAAATGAILVVVFLIGLYTSYYSTSFDESEALKGSFALGVKGTRLRNILIVLQFATAITLICFSAFIKRQHDFMLNYDWGLPTENVLYVDMVGLGESSTAFGQELLRDPRIKDYSIVRDVPGRVGMGWGRRFEDKQISLFVWSVDDRFFDFFEVEILQGRKPERMDSTRAQIVVNEAFMRKYEFDESIVGKDFPAFGPGVLQAVAKDVNFQSLHEEIVPMAFGVLSQWQNFAHILIKTEGSDLRGTISYIEDTWSKFSKEPTNVKFLDKELETLYTRENNMAQLIGLFGFIIVIIAVMGVYGLIVFNTRYKRKEIGIRKVNGASIKEVVLMLNRNLLILLAIAFVIAVPVSWYIITVWLEGFAYKAVIPWWLFPAAGLIVLAISAVAVSWQSYRAASANPAEVVKND